MKKICILLSILSLSFNISNTQTIIAVSDTVDQNDTVIFRLNDFIGDVQWQRSLDSTTWSDVNYANADTFMFIADQSSFVRASVTVGICDPFISDVAEIVVNIPYENNISEVYDQGRFVYRELDLCMHKLCISDLIKKGSHLIDQPPFYQYVSLVAFDADNFAVKDLWDGYYEGLSKVNIIISAINRSGPPADSVTINVLGQAYFFRAYFHKSLVERWDNIVLANSAVIDIWEDPVIAAKEDVYDLIVSDLDTAIILLPEASDVNSRIEISKGVARHLLSLVHMDLENWTEAAALAEQVVSDPAYALLPAGQLEDVFSVHTQENSEVVFSWHHDTEHKQYCSVQLVSLYDRVDGVTRSFEQGGRAWARLYPSDYYWSLFEENDPRLEVWHKMYWVYDIDDAFDPLPPGVSIGDTVTADNVAGTGGYDFDDCIVPTVKKYWEDGTLGRVVAMVEGYRNIIQYRVSQAYLIAAEAYMKAGDDVTAQQYLDALRTARNMTTITATMDNILDEHARELGLEGHRFPMLKRLGILYDRVNANPEWTGIIQDYHVRWPIPQSIIDITGLPQNPGYN